MPRTFLLRLLIAGLAVLPGTGRAFEYAGLGLDLEPTKLQAQFPSSRHEFWQHGTGSIAVPGEEDGRFEQWIETGDGRYVIQLAPDDTRAEVTNISLSLRSGLLQRLTLGFQRGGQGIKPDMIEKRFPGCRGVLDALVARYGQPQAFVSEMEENLEHRVRSWRGPEGTLHLDCGRFTGRTAIFAMDLEIEAPGTPSAWPEPAPKPARKKR